MNKVKLALITIFMTLAITWLALPAQAAVADNQSCLFCHGEYEFKTKYLGESQANPALYVEASLFRQSSHGTYTCKVCHLKADEKVMPLTGKTSLQVKQEGNESCAGCHSDAAKALKNSAHGDQAVQKEKKVFCTDCHGSHNIQKKELQASSVSRSNITATCTACHDGKEKTSYTQSFHGRALSMGSLQTATCADCHGSHATLGPKNPESNVAPLKVSKTCAKCHASEDRNFGKGAEHFVEKPSGPGAPVYWVKKVFSWLIIFVLGFMVIHVELDLLSYIWHHLPQMIKKKKG